MKAIVLLCGILAVSQVVAALGPLETNMTEHTDELSVPGSSSLGLCTQGLVAESCEESIEFVKNEQKQESMFAAVGVDVPFKKGKGPIHAHASFSRAKNRNLSTRFEGRTFHMAAKILCKKLRLWSRNACLKFLYLIRRSPAFTADLTCRYSSSPGQCSSSQFPFRTANGSCNNLKTPRSGQAGIPFERFLVPLYDDGVETPRNKSVTGKPLPSPRTVSRLVHTNVSNDLNDFTHLVMQWGQWTDHDIDATPMVFGEDGSEMNCCEQDYINRLNTIELQKRGLTPREIEEKVNQREGCFPIRHPRDPVFNNNTCMNFVRSLSATPINCRISWREQQNDITSFIDASNIYGSSKEVQSFSTNSETLRTGTGGLLLVAPNRNEELLPLDTVGEGACIVDFINRPNELCFRAGDGRSNEFVSLTSFHTMWLREHNRVARILGDEHPDWDDERIFQEARRIIAAFNQHITYNEWLPILLGPRLMKSFGLTPLTSGYFTGYNFKTIPTIRNSFATAAFRVGHSFINSQLTRVDENFKTTGFSPLITGNSFFRPNPIFDGSQDGPDSILRGMAYDRVQNFDRFITEQVTERLFEDRFESPRQPALDLAALNIQRGRDHGLPPYVAFRKLCNPWSRGISSFYDLRYTHSYASRQALQRAYANVTVFDIDLFTGGLSERKIYGSLIGPTFGCLIAAQFRILKEGDRFYYENKPSRITQAQGFSEAELAEIRKVSLAGILCNNAGPNEMQPNAFKVDSVLNNARINCKEINQPDIRVFNSKEAFTGTDLPYYVKFH